MKKELIKKLNGLKKKIDIMPNNYQRSIYIMNYFHILAYLRDTKQMNNYELKKYNMDSDTTKMFNIIQKNLNNFVNQLERCNNKLIEIDFELKNVYDNNNWHKLVNFDSINKDYGKKIVSNFFKLLNDDVFILYNEMKNSNISYSSLHETNLEGTCYEILESKYSYINLDNSSFNLSSLSTLVHEVGHAYHNYLLRNHPKLTYYTIVDETMSSLFEKLFFKYLEKNYSNCFNVNALWYEYYSLSYYQLANLLLTSVLLQDKKVIEINSNLRCKTCYSVDEVIELAEDLECVVDDNPNLNIRDYIYLIGDLISDYFLKIMDNDFNEGFKTFCNFMQEANYYAISEILDKYCSDLTYTKQNIERVIEIDKSYQKKK